MTDFQVDRIVKLVGTDYDRRRKLSCSDVTRIKRLYKSGHSISDLMEEYNVSYATIRCHVDPEYKSYHNMRRNDYAPSAQDYVAQRVSRVAHKRSILEGKV